MEHTPRPWRLQNEDGTPNEDQSGRFYKVVDEQDVTVADIPIQPLDGGWSEANARLIVIAPDLLAYQEYVEGKIDIGEMPYRYSKWLEIDSEYN